MSLCLLPSWVMSRRHDLIRRSLWTSLRWPWLALRCAHAIVCHVHSCKRVRVFVCVCVFVKMCVCMNVCLYEYVCIYICMCTYIYLYLYLYIIVGGNDECMDKHVVGCAYIWYMCQLICVSGCKCLRTCRALRRAHYAYISVSRGNTGYIYTIIQIHGFVRMHTCS